MLAVTLLTGCARLSDSEERRIQEAELTARSLMAAWQRADRELIEDLFWPDATYDDFPNQHTYQGIQEILDYVQAMHAWADNVFMNVGRVHVTTSGAVVEWDFSAIQARPMGAISVGTGAEVVTNGVTIIELRGDRIIRAADYTDTAPMMLQVGGRIELPGGTVMEMEMDRARVP
ncbi:MAG: nuclear transport factor 2 family protein [Gemmatimonadota bacterium]|nr:nuclear transport factor 2 family protein [Gemmatimonadota bacterium]MDE3007199.1 nuclear transport factor 2 family protein [Gemmatimonadota bacterium]MDE3012502.1 nuclear transport factor 2 family protein [Gemmatimonadota bacterium]